LRRDTRLARAGGARGPAEGAGEGGERHVGCGGGGVEVGAIEVCVCVLRFFLFFCARPRSVLECCDEEVEERDRRGGEGPCGENSSAPVVWFWARAGRRRSREWVRSVK
jgi:hypothetical protein